MSPEEQRRAGFEAHANQMGWSIAPKQSALRGIHHPRQYHMPAVEMAWQVWNAALDSVMIDLPESFTYCEQMTGYESDPVMDSGEVIAAIEAVGLKVKP